MSRTASAAAAEGEPPQQEPSINPTSAARRSVGAGLVTSGLMLVILLVLGTFTVVALLFMLPPHVTANIPLLARPTPALPSPTAPTPRTEPATSTGAPGEELSSRVNAMENRAVQLQASIDTQEEALSSTVENLRFLIGGLGILLTVVVGGQAYFQYRHESSQQSGANEVSGVMTVIRQTLQTRLDAERMARRDADRLREEMKDLRLEITESTKFRLGVLSAAQHQRAHIEKLADGLADAQRHEFRDMVDRLNAFAREYDSFESQFGSLTDGSDSFSSKVVYVRGIAAHYANDPDRATDNLTKVTQTARSPGEANDAYDRRIATAHYYLGVTNSNFGLVNEAARAFGEVIRRDPTDEDLLTRVVAAEALAFAGQEDLARGEARRLVAAIEQDAANRRMSSGDLRLKSRLLLMLANIAIMRNDSDHRSQVESLLQPVLVDDPEYYYPIVTLAQVKNDVAPAEAAEMFRQALSLITASTHLIVVTEKRSQVLLQMTAALCYRHLISDPGDPRHAANLRRSDTHLDKADHFRRELPKLGTVSCTVFSTLTKFNETSDVIHANIQMIRAGHVLLPGRVQTG